MIDYVRTLRSYDDLFSACYILALSSARFYGLTLTFTIFSWGQVGTGVLRMVFALCLAMPVMAGNSTHAQDILATMTLPVPLLVIRELAIGALIGFICALPFQALVTAGSVIDTTRGVSTPLSSPTGESSSVGLMFEVSAIWLFVTMGGLWRIADAVYASYGLWPLSAGFPEFSSKSLDLLILMVTKIGQTVIVIAGPLLVLMLLCDSAVYVTSKLGKHMNIASLAPNIKNIALMLILPLFMIVFIRLMTRQFEDLFGLTRLIDQLADITNGR